MVGERELAMDYLMESLVRHSHEELKGPERTRPHLVTNPADDSDFRRFAEASLTSGVTPAALQSALRLRHPAAVVHARMLSGEARAVWYVYRDGHWVARRRNHPPEADERA